MEAAVKKADGLVLRKVNIKKWGSEVAKQYSVRRLPRFELYGPGGQLLQSGGTALKTVLNWKGPPTR